MGVSGLPKSDSGTSSTCEPSAETTSNTQKPLSSSIPKKRKRNRSEVAPLASGPGLKSQIFDVRVGSEPCRFSVHEHYLSRSLKLRSMCASAKLRSSKSKMVNVLTLPNENPTGMEYLFKYLYFDTLDIALTDASEEAKLLRVLFIQGCEFQLNGLVKKVVIKLKTSKISSRIPAMQFLALMEELYLEPNIDDLNTYFAKIASGLIKTLKGPDFTKIEQMIGEGGPYACALFKAFRELFVQKSKETSQEDPKGSKIAPKAESDEPDTKKTKFSIPGSPENLKKVMGGQTFLVKLMDNINNPKNRIPAGFKFLRDSDIPHLLQSKFRVETALEEAKWEIISEVMVVKGGTIQYPATVLRRVFSGEGVDIDGEAGIKVDGEVKLKVDGEVKMKVDGKEGNGNEGNNKDGSGNEGNGNEGNGKEANGQDKNSQDGNNKEK